MKRRFFLQGVGGAMVAAPMLSTLVEKKAAAAATSPIRTVIFFTHNGCNTNKWFPVIENGPITAADLSPTLAPLSDVVDKLLIPRGIASLNPYASRQAVDPHNQAMGSKMTCALIEEGRESNYATGISFDHILAEGVNPGGASPLLLSVGQRSTSIKEVVSFSAPATPYVSEVNPAVVYSQLTGVLSAASSGGGVPSEPSTEADYRVLRGQSVLDVVRHDLERYQSLNMGRSDKLRIEAWLDMLRDTETTMMGGDTVGGVATASCNEGFRPSPGAACTRTTTSSLRP